MALWLLLLLWLWLYSVIGWGRVVVVYAFLPSDSRHSPKRFFVFVSCTSCCAVPMQNDLLSTLDEIRATSAPIAVAARGRPSSTPCASAAAVSSSVSGAKLSSGAGNNGGGAKSSRSQSQSCGCGCARERTASTDARQLHPAALGAGAGTGRERREGETFNVVSLITPAILRVVNFAKQIPGFSKVSSVLCSVQFILYSVFILGIMHRGDVLHCLISRASHECA